MPNEQPRPPEASQHPQPEQLAGLVERVTFHSDESGYCVLRIKARGHRDLVTVVGTLPEVRAGEWLEAQGRWIVDKEYGQQFRSAIRCSFGPYRHPHDHASGRTADRSGSCPTAVRHAEKAVRHVRHDIPLPTLYTQLFPAFALITLIYVYFKKACRTCRMVPDRVVSVPDGGIFLPDGCRTAQSGVGLGCRGSWMACVAAVPKL
jgi:hypothetical protein